MEEEAMRYTEEFKKQVVKKILSPGVFTIDVARKLRISAHTIHVWKKLYGDEVRATVIQIDIEKMLHEEPVNIEKMLLEAEPEEKQRELEAINRIEKGKPAAQYKTQEKYVIIHHLKRLGAEEAGAFLRSFGLQGGHIRQWEDEILSMGKKHMDQDELIKKLEEENKELRKKLKEAERDKRELEILIELKKKYKTLFEQDEED
jgi:transposase-like protein